jgi:hypothetical protein
LLNQLPDLSPGDAVAYSYLFKNLEFEHLFETMERGARFGTARFTRFGTARFKGFGFRADRSKQKTLQEAANQVTIHDYKSRDDFVIEVATKSKGDRLLLAKIHPDSTLIQTIATVQSRADSTKGTLPEPETRMEVPTLDFRLTKDYEELLGKHIQCPNARLSDQFFVMVRQLVQFKLNEEGAKLKSEAVVVTKQTILVGHGPPQLIFDKPFLILMEHKGAANPYFALWIDNSELLVPFVEEKPKQ